MIPAAAAPARATPALPCGGGKSPLLSGLQVIA